VESYVINNSDAISSEEIHHKGMAAVDQKESHAFNWRD